MAIILEKPGVADVRDFDPELVKRIAIKAVVRLLAAWRVRDDAAARLVGVGSIRTWRRMKKEGWSGGLSQDHETRMSALVGLYERLHLYFGQKLADEWVSLDNNGPLFRGTSPLEFMLQGGVPAIIRVRDYVDALRTVEATLGGMLPFGRSDGLASE